MSLKVMSKNEFWQAFTVLAHACKFNIDQTIANTYYSELNHIPLENLAEAMKYFTLQNRWPSVIDIQKRCNSVVEYKQPEKRWADSNVNVEVKTFDSWLSGVKLTNNPQDDFKKYDSLAYMIRLKYPAFSSLQQSVEHWKACIVTIREAGWFIHAWDEFEGKTEVEQEHAGKTTKTECRVYYARCLVGKTRLQEPILKNHFEHTGVVYAYPEVVR